MAAWSLLLTILHSYSTTTALPITTSPTSRQRQTITTCDNPLGCDWTCGPDDIDCAGLTFVCTASAPRCSLQCLNCNNTRLLSASQQTSISCLESAACTNLIIIAETPQTQIQLICGSDHNQCSNITLSCPANSTHNCQCVDDGQNVCQQNVAGHFIINPSPSTSTTEENEQVDIDSDNVFAVDDEEATEDDPGTLVLTIVAVALTVAFACLVCVAIPCWVWRIRRKSQLNSGDSEVGVFRHQERAYQVAEQSQTDMSEGIYGRGGAAPVTVTEMMPINEVDEDEDLDEDYVDEHDGRTSRYVE